MRHVPVDDRDDRLLADQVALNGVRAESALGDHHVAAALHVVPPVELFPHLAPESAEPAQDHVPGRVVGLRAVVQAAVEQDLAELRYGRGQLEQV